MDFTVEICHELLQTSLSSNEFAQDLISIFNDLEGNESANCKELNKDGLVRYLSICDKDEDVDISKWYDKGEICRAVLKRASKDELPNGAIIDFSARVFYTFGSAAMFTHEDDDLLNANSKTLQSYKKIVIPIPISENASHEDIPKISDILLLCLVTITWSIRMFDQNQFLWYKILCYIASHKDVNEKNAREFLKAFRKIDCSCYSLLDRAAEKKVVKSLVKGLVENDASFSTVVAKIAKRYPKYLNDSEREFVKRKYLKYHRRIFHNELVNFIEKNEQLVTGHKNLEQLSLWLRMEDEIPHMLRCMKTYKSYVACMKHMTPQHHRSFMNKTASVFHDALNTLITEMNRNADALLTGISEVDQSTSFDDVDGLTVTEKTVQTDNLALNQKPYIHDKHGRVLKAMANIKDRLSNELLSKGFPVAHKIIKHSESFAVTATQRIANEVIILKDLLQKSKSDEDDLRKVDYPDVKNQDGLEKIESLNTYLLNKSEHSIEELSGLYQERATFSSQLKGNWMQKTLSYVLNRKDFAKVKLLKRNEELLSVIVEKLRISWLLRFGSMLHDFESMQYEESEFGTLLIKMRLVHANFSLVKKVLELQSNQKLEACVLEKFNAIVNFFYDVTSLRSEINETESDNESTGNGDDVINDEEVEDEDDVFEKERDVGSACPSQVTSLDDDRKKRLDAEESFRANDDDTDTKDRLEPAKDYFSDDDGSGNEAITIEDRKLRYEKCEIPLASSKSKHEGLVHDGNNSNDVGSQENYQNLPDFDKQKERKKRCDMIIAEFEARLSKRDDLKLPERIVSSIRMLQYLDFEETSTLLQVLTRKILLEGTGMSLDVLQWILNLVSDQTDAIWIKIFTWVFGLNSLRAWASEYLVQYLIYSGRITVGKEKEFRDVFCAFQDQRWLPGIWQLTSKTDDMLLILNVASFLKSNPYDDSLLWHILQSNCSKWEAILETHYACKILLDLPVDWSANKLIEANAYLDQLRTMHGKIITERLIGLLQSIGKTTETLVLKILRRFYTDYWRLSNETLGYLAGKSIDVWEETLDVACFSKEERSLDCLIEMIRNDLNNSERFRDDNDPAAKATDRGGNQESDLWKTVLTNTIADGRIADTFGEEFVKDWEHNFYEKIALFINENENEKENEKKIQVYKDKIQNWSTCIKSRASSLSEGDKKQFLMKNITEIFAHIEIGISLVTGYKLRQVQRLSLLLMLLSKDRALLQQVATGEGKTIIIVGFCIAQALLGHTVDVITSSTVLAERDATDTKNVAVYQLFGVSVSHNGSDDMKVRTEAYKCDIVYGEIGSFQRDLLLQQFYCLQIIGERKADVLAVDEADSMLLDNAEKVLYLSHDIQDLDTLEPIFVYIWNFVHCKGMYGTKNDVETVKSALLNAIYGSVRRNDVIDALFCLGESRQDIAANIWDLMINKEIVDEKGRILKKEELMDNAVELDLPSFENTTIKSAVIAGLVLNCLKDTVKMGSEITVPNHLESFIAMHLSDWVKNAFKAKTMEERCHYIIEKDASLAENSDTAKVIIMDTDTGKEQFNMIWSDGLHQFLQLKHGCKCTALSLKAVFSSNTQFFKAYEGSVYGLTGTLGSLQERKVLQEMFDVDYVNIPTFRAKRFSLDEDRVFSSKEDWMQELAKVSKEIAQERPVLLICETIQELEMVHKLLEDGTVELYVYKHSYQPIDAVKNDTKIEKGCIILATNLAGRGTDIKISDEMEAKGGLHVILTYLPRNIRVQEQAFGRTARKGQHGSGQLFIDAGAAFEGELSDLARLCLLVKKRNDEERERLSLIIDHYEKRIKREEHFFTKFKELFLKIVKLTQSQDTEYRKIIESACIDQWSFWLDSLSSLLDASIDEQEASWKTFSDELIGCLDPDARSRTSLNKMIPSAMLGIDPSACNIFEVVRGISLKVSLGLYYLEKKEYTMATNIFMWIIYTEANFSEAAHYYQVYSLVKQTNLATADDKLRAKLHLSKAEDILSARIDMHSKLVGIVKGINSLHARANDSFTAVSIYNKQKENLVNLLSCFKGTIVDMLGHDINEQTLENAIGDKMLAERVSESNLATENRFFDVKGDGSSEIEQEFNKFISSKLKHFSERYSLYLPEIKCRIAELKNSEKALSANDFIDVLPSREEFWRLLKENGSLEDVKNFVIIDIEKLSKNRAVQDSLKSVIERLMKASSTDEFQIFEDGEVASKSREETERSDKEEHVSNETLRLCLYPEDLKDLSEKKKVAINVTRQEQIESWYWKILTVYDVISHNEIASLRKSKRKQQLGKYDSFVEADLLEIPGVSKGIASEIFNELDERQLQHIDKISLEMHKKFEVDVKNLIKKRLQYREYLEKSVQDNSLPYEELECHTHEKLWQDLIDLRIILAKKIEASFGEDDFKAKIDDKKKELEKDYSGSCYNFVWKGTDEIASAMVQLSSTISRYQKVDANFKDFVQILDDKTKAEAACEIQLLSNMGLTKVIVLEKKKSWWSTFWEIVGIIALGIAQICVGVIIEVFTLGAGTFIAEGFIGEGVGDLMFAAECIISWHCSMKEYLKQKAISLCITVLTCGVGAWFARGAKFSRFGSKIAKEFESVAGKELLEKAGTRRVAKEAVKRVGKKVAEGTALGLANAAVSKLVEKLLKDFLKSMCSDVLSCIRDIVGFTELKEAIIAMYCKLGEENCRITALRVCNEGLSDEEGGFQDKAVRIFDGISQGFGKALEKMKAAKASGAKFEVFEEVTELLAKFAKLAPYLKAIAEMKNTVETFKVMIPKLIRDETTKLANDGNCLANEEKVNGIMVEIEGSLVERLEEILEHQIIDPLLHHHVSKFVNYSGHNLRQKYRDMEAHFQWKKFRRTVASTEETIPIGHDMPEEHVKLSERVQDERILALTRLQKRVRDPDLYAEILERTNVPMGIHEVLALSTAFNSEIKIIQYGKDGQNLIQDVFKPPSKGERNAPITIYFRPDKNGGTGHFSAKPFQNEKAVSSGKNNCLLDTIKGVTGTHVTRSQVADIVRSTPVIREDISKAYHKHYVDVGGIGGAERSAEQQKKLNTNYENIRQKVEAAWREGRTYVLTPDEKESLLDRPQFASYVAKNEVRPSRPSLGSSNRQSRRSSAGSVGQQANTKSSAAKADKRQNQTRRTSKEERILVNKEVTTGNHEGVGREHTVKLMTKDLEDKKAHREPAKAGGITIHWIDLSKEVRFDIRYCVIEHENTVHGHPKAICSDPSMAATFQKIRGSKEKLHANVGEKAVRESKTADECAIKILNGHLDAIGSREKFMKSYENNKDFFNNW